MIGLLFLSLASAQDVSTDLSSSSAESRRVTFAEDLYQRHDLTLLGLDAIASVSFPLPRAWELTGDPELHLRLDHSAMLDPARSTLTIALNGDALHTLALDQANAVDGVLVLPLPRRVLADHNRLQFEASQHGVQECEDPYDPALWTRILSESSIHFPRTLRPLTPTLSGFPELLLDPTGLDPLTLTVAGRGTPGEATLDALGRVAFGLGRHAGYRGVTLAPAVARVAQSETHTLVVGTADDNPLIAELVDVAALEPGQGLIQALVHPRRAHLGVLVVTGADSEGLDKAANAVSSAEVQELLSGSRVLIEASRALSVPPLDQVPRPAPAALSFTLADLGIADQTVRGTYAPSLVLPLSLQADSVVRPHGASLRLDYAYGAQLDPTRSSIEVLLNGVSLRSVALDRPQGDPRAQLTVDLRDALVHPASEVTVLFHLVPEAQEVCILQRNRQLWATVFETTRFEVDRLHTAKLPDLALLRHRLWPLGQGLSREGVAILLPDQPSWQTATAGMQVAAELGRASEVLTPDLVMLAGGPDTLGQVSGRQLLVLSDGTPHGPLRVVELMGSLKAEGGTLRRLTGPDGALLVDAEVSQPASTLEQVVYQVEPVRTALVLQAQEPAALLDLAAALGDADTLRRLDGSAAFLEVDGEIATHALAEQVVVGRPSVWSRLSLVLSSTGLPLALVLAFVGTLATIVVSRWAGGRHGQV